MPNATTCADGLLVKIRQGAETSTLRAIGQRLGTEIQSTQLCQELPWHHIQAKNLAGENTAKVFDIAHSLLDIAGILAIEPNLEISRKEEQKLAEVFDPKTDCEYAWHIEKVKADVARKQFSVTGENVRVAHLDTGYTEHPELVIGTAVREDLGCNFYEKTGDPREPLNTIEEGHGTATASVLVGLAGKQHKESDPAYVEGVAPGAELVPIRVDYTYYWFLNQARDVQGICHALKQGCQVISMSRGGPHYDALRDAIQLAISRGTIVVAAAGNCIPWCEDIWSPANYKEVVCAAGSTFDMTPWEGSSRGPEVTIAAPAWSVYRARTVNKNNAYAFNVERSSGTSYATPIVAGAAALWIQRHGGAAALAEKLQGVKNIASSFKYLLGKSAQPGKNWDTEFGPGILDCVKLLSSDLPKPEDIPKIENDLRKRSNASRGGLAEQVLSNRIGKSDDPRAQHLWSLEIEATAIRNPQIESLLAAPTKGKSAKRLAGTNKIAKALAEDPGISTTLRRILKN